MATKPPKQDLLSPVFQPCVQSQPLARCTKVSSFLMPHLINLPMPWTALQNKQSFEYCVRILGHMLSWCWLSLLWVPWPKSTGIPQSLVYHNCPNMCLHNKTQVCSRKGRIIPFCLCIVMCCRQRRGTLSVKINFASLQDMFMHCTCWTRVMRELSKQLAWLCPKLKEPISASTAH